MENVSDKTLNVLKLICVIGGGIIAFVGSEIFGNIIKDRKFDASLRKKLSDKFGN